MDFTTSSEKKSLAITEDDPSNLLHESRSGTGSANAAGEVTEREFGSS